MSLEAPSALENEKKQASNKSFMWTGVFVVCASAVPISAFYDISHNLAVIVLLCLPAGFIALGVSKYYEGVESNIDGRMRSIFFERLTTLIEELPGFSATDQYSGLDDSGIAIDANHGYCALYWVNNNEWDISNMPFSKLLSSELRLDENSVIKTDRFNQAAGALVGATLAGGVGAIVGGLSAKTVSTKEIKRVSLRLVVDDLTRPIHDIPFYTIEDEQSHSTNTLQKAVYQAERWQALLSVAIHRG